MAEVATGVVTVTSTEPALPGGTVAMIEVDELTVKLEAGVEPNVTAVAPVRLVPVIGDRGAAGNRASRRAHSGDRRGGVRR